MNANELADELEIAQGNNNFDELIPEVITMLRQQHTSLISDVDVIERLTKEIKVKDEAIFNSEKQAYNLAMQVQNQKALIKQLEETQVYLYKTHDADKAEIEALKVSNQALKILNDGKNKIIEEYEHKYPDFFFMEHDIQGER